MNPRICDGAILQREVEVAGVPEAAVRELALDPDLEELGFEQIADADGQLGDASGCGATPDAACGGRGRRRSRRRLLVVFKR